MPAWRRATTPTNDPLQLMTFMIRQTLQEVIDTELRRRHLQRLETGAGLDLADDEVMRAAWR